MHPVLIRFAVMSDGVKRQRWRLVVVVCPLLSTQCAESSNLPTSHDSSVDQTAAEVALSDQSPDGPSLDGDVNPATDDCITDMSAGAHTFACRGIDFDINVPAQCLDAPCGLVFDVHGRTMSGAMQDNNTGLQALGASRGYIVVQPSANPDPPAASWSTTDDAIVFSFMQHVIATFHVDPQRVHFTGFSQGGYMSWRFICEHADVIASAAPAAAAHGCLTGIDTSCLLEPGAPAQEVDILYMHGREDALVNFSCSDEQRNSVVSAYGLGTPTTISSDDSHSWTRQQNDRGGVFEFIEHSYESNQFLLRGHCFPGSTDPGGEPGQVFSFACEGASAFNWGEAVMDFFVTHPRD